MTPSQIAGIRAATGKTQEQFAAELDIPVGTLRHWEQGSRKPTGPAMALLRRHQQDQKKDAA